jgi:hypothetical protein
MKMLKSLWVRVIAVSCWLAAPGPARAFGGLWAEAGAMVEPTGAQVVFVDRPDATLTAVVRVRYAGSAKKLAWLLPVPGKPKVSVSSNVLFERLQAATLPQYWVEQATEGRCKDEGLRPDEDVSSPTSLTVIEQGAAGPYSYTLLQPSAAKAWLRAHGFAAQGVELPAGHNVLAVELVDAAEGGVLPPLQLSYERARPSIPLLSGRAPLQVWVFGPSQAVPENYPSLVLNDARIDWSSASRFPAGTLPANGVGPFGPPIVEPKNYETLVHAAVSEAGGRAFVTELAGPASQYRSKVWSELDASQLAQLVSQKYSDAVDMIVQAKLHYNGWDGWTDTVKQTVSLPKGVSLQAFLDNPAQYRGQAQVDARKFSSLLDLRVIKPVRDVAALLSGTPYLTRLSGAGAALDPAFTYNPELAQVSQVHIAKQTVECDASLAHAEAPWRMVLPQDGVVRGSGRGQWPAAPENMPLNLKVVTLSDSGSGAVVADNSAQIGKLLFAAAKRDGQGEALPPRPQLGVRIGGTQAVRAPLVVPRDDGQRAGDAAAPSGTSPQHALPPSSTSRCSVTRVGALDSSGLPWLLVASMLCLVRVVRRSRVSLLVLVLLSACRGGPPADTHNAGAAAPDARALTPEQLRDPESCKGCHPVHFREWSSSMHAYAARDPVFIAMNQRGQRETHGELGDLCIKCHAPMAVVDKLSKDGLNLDQLPDRQRGVSCYFCHNVTGIEGDHNAMLTLAKDTTMRGPIADPFTTRAHHAEQSELFDENHPRSSAMCGGCHDLVLPNGVHLERTFKEYRDGLFSKSATGNPPSFGTCIGCHMPGSRMAVADVPGAPERVMHEHLWPGIDLPLIDAPNSAALRSAVEDCQLGAQTFSYFSLEVTPPDLFSFQLETNAGHNQPSGAAQDRRLWFEFRDDEPEDKHDPQLLMFRDRIYDAHGKEVHMFWEAAPSPEHPEGFEASALPVATTTYIEGKHSVFKQYRASGPDGKLPARVTARLRMRAIGQDVLQDLVASGDLDPAIAKRMPTLSFGAKIEWTPEAGVNKTVYTSVKSDCIKYRCLLDPSLPVCR